MIHVIKHDMDPNSNVNYRRKIGPVTVSREETVSATEELLCEQWFGVSRTDACLTFFQD